MSEPLTAERIAEMRHHFEPSCTCEIGDGEECEECRPWQTLCSLISHSRELEAEVERRRGEAALTAECSIHGIVACTACPQCLVLAVQERDAALAREGALRAEVEVAYRAAKAAEETRDG